MTGLTRIAHWAARGALGLIFLYAGLIKAGASEQFLIALMPFTFLPPGSLLVVALVLPWVEIAAGGAMFFPRVWRAAAAVLGILSLVFAGVLLWALASGIIVSCGCFGTDDEPSAAKMLLAAVRDILLAAIAARLVFHRSGRSS